MRFKKTLSILALSTLVVSNANLISLASENKDFNARIITVADTVSYLAIDTKKIDSPVSKLYLDGVLTDFTPVSSDGKIIKTEFNGKHKSIRLELENGEQVEKTISGIYNVFPYTADNSPKAKAPDLVTGHVSIAVWDYHSVEKDSNGEEIQFPKESTFEINDSARDIDTVSSPTPSNNDNQNKDIEKNIQRLNIIAKDISKEHKYIQGQDIEIEFNLNSSSDSKLFGRLKDIKIDGTKDKLKIKKEKNTSEKKATVKISASENTGLKNISKNLKLRFRFKSLNDKVMTLNVVQDLGKSNPKEDISPNTVDYGKNIDLVYNISNTEEAKKFRNLKKAVKVYDDGHEEKLYLSKNKNNTATILFASSRPIQNRGKHRIKLIYDNMDSEIREFNIKDKSPTIKLNSNNGAYKTGKSLLFTIDNFEYLFQQDTGVECVYINGHKLTRGYVPNSDENPDKLSKNGVKVIENEEENPYHIVGDLLRLKNSAIEYLKPGINHLTVKYSGYHDSNFKFVLENSSSNKNSTSKQKKRSKRAIDTMTSATGGGVSSASVGSGSGSGGGSVNMGAKIVYNFDMVANAKIVEDLGYNNKKASGLLDYWEGTAKEMALMKDNPYRRVKWDDYLNYVQSNRLNNKKYKSFIDYYNSAGVSLTKNGYSPIKFALGNGLGAPIFDFYSLFDGVYDEPKEGEAKKVPSTILSKLDNIFVREDLILPLNEWSVNIRKISLNGRDLKEKSDFIINRSSSTLTIPSKNFTEDGNYLLKVESNGFENLEKNILVRSEKDKNTIIRLRDNNRRLFTGEPIKFEIMDDARVTGIYITPPEGELKPLKNTEYSYLPYANQLNIYGNVIRKPGKYTARVYFAGRRFQDIDFYVFGKEINYIMSPISKSTTLSLESTAYSLKMANITGNRDVSHWLDSIAEVRVNGITAEKKNGSNKNAPLLFDIRRDKDSEFDRSGYLYVESNLENPFNLNSETINIDVVANDYSTVRFTYKLKGNALLSNSDIRIKQIDPDTNEELTILYDKNPYIDRYVD